MPKSNEVLMKKTRAIIFRCSECEHEEPKWLGRCPSCGAWNTMQEHNTTQSSAATRTKGAIPRSIPLQAIDAEESQRLSTGIPEFDRVLGGGLMRRSCVLVGGEPGIGKSTLLLQAAAGCQTKGRVLYISGEESAAQIKQRAIRTNCSSERVEVLCSSNLADIERVMEAVKPVLMIVDSVQTLSSPELGPVPGTVNQMKYCSHELISWCKEHDCVLLLVAHVTKEGAIAGPKALEHMVDTVLYFEQNEQDNRFLRASKNRFGSVDETGIFIMGEKGLNPVDDPSSIFLVRREGETPAGVATAAVLEGSRTLLVELQALVVPCKGGSSRVYSDRIDSARVSRIAATLEKHLSIKLSDNDLYINVAGGMRITEVGVDLPLAAAIFSARTGLSVTAHTALAGELSLTGEIRPVKRLSSRVRAAKNLGYTSFIGPKLQGRDASDELKSEDWTQTDSIADCIKTLFSGLEKNA
jgi:DNA repair protein RadA/Sms